MLSSNIFQMNNQIELQITNLAITKQLILAFTEAFEICNYYDSNGINSPLNYDRFECLAAFGCIEKVKGNFQQVCQQIEFEKRWVMGYFAYEVNETFNTEVNLEDSESNIGAHTTPALRIISAQLLLPAAL